MAPTNNAAAAASSSQDDDDDSSSSSDGQSLEEQGMDLPTDDSVSLDDESSGSSDEEGEESDDQEDHHRSLSDSSSPNDTSESHDSSDGDDEVSEQDRRRRRRQDEYELSSDLDEEAEHDDVPLGDRVERQRQAGRSEQLADARNRKKHALQVASKRLAAIQHEKKKKKPSRGKHIDHSETIKRSKNAPTEVSSKRYDYFRRGAPALNSSGVGVEIGAHSYKPRDPRVSSLSGHLDNDRFDKNYAFLQEMRQEEIQALKRKIAARKKTGRKGQKLRRKLGLSQGNGSLEEDKADLRRLQEEKTSYERSQVERAAKQAVQRKLRDDVASGKRGVYYLKRRERKRLELEAKFEELRKRGGDRAVEKALAKRRKKNKSRDTGLMPKEL